MPLGIPAIVTLPSRMSFCRLLSLMKSTPVAIGFASPRLATPFKCILLDIERLVLRKDLYLSYYTTLATGLV